MPVPRSAARRSAGILVVEHGAAGGVAEHRQRHAEGLRQLLFHGIGDRAAEP